MPEDDDDQSLDEFGLAKSDGDSDSDDAPETLKKSVAEQDFKLFDKNQKSKAIKK